MGVRSKDVPSHHARDMRHPTPVHLTLPSRDHATLLEDRQQSGENANRKGAHARAHIILYGKCDQGTKVSRTFGIFLLIINTIQPQRPQLT